MSTVDDVTKPAKRLYVQQFFARGEILFYAIATVAGLGVCVTQEVSIIWLFWAALIGLSAYLDVHTLHKFAVKAQALQLLSMGDRRYAAELRPVFLPQISIAGAVKHISQRQAVFSAIGIVLFAIGFITATTPLQVWHNVSGIVMFLAIMFASGYRAADKTVTVDEVMDNLTKVDHLLEIAKQEKADSRN